MPPRKKHIESVAASSGETVERISIREAAKRIGITDTSLGRYKKLGVIKVVGYTAERGWPLVQWPDVKNDYEAYCNAKMRRNQKSKEERDKERAELEAVAKEERQKAREAREAEWIPAAPKPPPSPDMLDLGTATIADSRALHEQYKAKMARLEYEEKVKKLVDVEAVKSDAFNVARVIREEIMNIPDRLAHELAYETDPAQVHLMITNELREVLERLADMNL